MSKDTPEDLPEEPVDYNVLGPGMRPLRPRNSISLAAERLYDEIYGPGAYWTDRVNADAAEAAVRPSRPRAPSSRTIEDDKLRFLVKGLFSLDMDEALTVAAVRDLPVVREWQAQQGIEDGTLTKLISKAAPDYARGPRGRPVRWEAGARMPFLSFLEK